MNVPLSRIKSPASSVIDQKIYLIILTLLSFIIYGSIFCIDPAFHLKVKQSDLILPNFLQVIIYKDLYRYVKIKSEQVTPSLLLLGWFGANTVYMSVYRWKVVSSFSLENRSLCICSHVFFTSHSDCSILVIVIFLNASHIVSMELYSHRPT